MAFNLVENKTEHQASHQRDPIGAYLARFVFHNLE